MLGGNHNTMLIFFQGFSNTGGLASQPNQTKHTQ